MNFGYNKRYISLEHIEDGVFLYYGFGILAAIGTTLTPGF